MHQLLRIGVVLMLLTVTGTIGFVWIERWPVFDALYMTIITLTTVGYGEVHNLSDGGRLFAMVFLVAGLGVFMYGAVSLGELIVKAQLGDWLGRNKTITRIQKMRDHFIVCGFGRFGRSLCEELAARGLPFVVVEAAGDVAATCKERDWPFVVGDATEDAVLAAAGIEHARGVACTLPSDAANLYVVMSSRLMRKDLQILTRATTEKDAEKLRRAGADRVISLYATGAAKMVQLMANPHVEDFLEVVTSRGKALDIAEVQVVPEAPYAGRTLAESGFRARGIMVVGIRRADGELLIPPGPHDRIAAGDFLIAIGKVEAVQELLRQDHAG